MCFSSENTTFSKFELATRGDDDDDVGLHVLGCRVDILGTNCKQREVLLPVLKY